jgi:ferritin-like metal-binding protein YciE
MENMNDLNDLLKHEIMDLYSVEEQIISAMPSMIEKARDPELKKALREHLKITEKQRSRLDQVQKLLGQEEESKDSGLFSRLFKSKQTCKGMEGIISEGNKIMKEDMDPEVMDAAILASSQKIEHYEICGYGTARSYAIQLGHNDVATLLSETLDEEYEADRLLTKMAENRINLEAEFETSGGNGSSQSRSGNRSSSKSRVEEPEMEMASGSRKSGSSSGRTGENSDAPKGSSSRSASGSARSASGSSGAAAKKTTASKSQSKSTNSRSSSGSGSGGRGSNSGRGNARSK